MILLGVILLIVGFLAQMRSSGRSALSSWSPGSSFFSSARLAGASVADDITGSGPEAGPASGGMPGPCLGIEVTISGQTATVVLRGALEPATMPLLARRLAQVLAGGPEHLVLDLAGVTFIDCASARLIAGAGRHLPAGVRPVVRFPSLAVRRVLTLTGLADHVEIGPVGGGRRRQDTGESAL